MSGIGLGHVYSMENGHLPFYNETFFFYLWNIRDQWIADAVIIECQEKGKICGQHWSTTLSGCKIHCWLSSMWMQLFKTSSSTVPQICEVPWLFWCQCQGHPGCQTFIVASQTGSEMSFRAKKLHSHAAQLTGGATAFLHGQKHPWNHLYEAQANASLLGRAQAMRWANSHDETSLTGCLTTLFHQGVYWSPPPQGPSGHRRCWRALNIVRSDYNSPTWAKNLSRAELILWVVITVFRCSRSVLIYSERSGPAFN